MRGREKRYLEVVVELDATELAGAGFGLFLADALLEVGFAPAALRQTALLAGLGVRAQVEQLATQLLVESGWGEGREGTVSRAPAG